MKYIVRIEIETDDPTGQVARELEDLLKETAEREYDVKVTGTDSSKAKPR